MKKDLHRPNDKEFEFMLLELSSERRLLDERHRRLEQIVTYFLTFAATLMAATVAIITSLDGLAAIIILLVACLILSAAGHIVWLNLISIKSSIAASQSHFYVRRQYFLDLYPKLEPYIEFRDKKEVEQVAQIHFGKTTRFLLILFASFNILLFVVFITGTSMLIANYVGTVGLYYEGILFGLLVFAGALAFELWLLKRRIDFAHKYSKRIFSAINQKSRVDGNKQSKDVDEELI